MSINLLDKEFSEMFPLTIVNDDMILYKNFKIKLNDAGHWDLYRLNGDVIHTFKLKSVAIMAAKYYAALKFKQIEEIKVLDFEYWSSSVDVSYYKHRLIGISDNFVKDVMISRLSSASDKKKRMKNEIIKRLNVDF